MKNKRILAAMTAAVCAIGLCGTLTASAYTVNDQVYDPGTGNTWHEGYETNAPLSEPLASAKSIIDRYFRESAIAGEVVIYVQDGVSTLMVLCENSTDEDAVRAFVESSGIDPALIREVGTKAYPAGEEAPAPMYMVYDQVYDPETGNTWHEGYETNAPLPEPLASAKNTIDRYFKENAIAGEVVIYVQDGVSTLMVLCENSTDEDAVRTFVESSGIDPALIREVGTKAYPAGEDNAPMYKVFDQDDLDSWYETNRPLDHDLAGFKSMIEQFMQENGIPGEVGLYTERKTASIAFSSLVVLCENSKDEEAVRTYLDSAGIVSTLIHSVGTKAYNATASDMQYDINRYMTGQNITGYTYVKPDGRLAVICASFDTADQIRRFVDTRDDYDTERIEYGVPTAPAVTTFNASTAAKALITSARIGAGQEPDELEPALDVNGDATLNASDAANILQYAAYVGAGNADIGIRDYMIGKVRENGICQFMSGVQWDLGYYVARGKTSAASYTKDRAIGKVRTLKGSYGDPLHFLISPDDDLYTVKDRDDVLLAVRADGSTVVLWQNAHVEPMIYAARIGGATFLNTYRLYDESLPEYEGEPDESKAQPLTCNAGFDPAVAEDGEANNAGMLRYIKLDAPEYAVVEIRNAMLDGWYLFETEDYGD